MTNEVFVLTREYGLQNLVTPTGRKFDLVKAKINPALLEITYGDGKGGDLPDKLKGHWTSRRAAEIAIRNFLEKMWDMSEEIAKEKKAKN